MVHSRLCEKVRLAFFFESPRYFALQGPDFKVFSWECMTSRLLNVNTFINTNEQNQYLRTFFVRQVCEKIETERQITAKQERL